MKPNSKVLSLALVSDVELSVHVFLHNIKTNNELQHTSFCSMLKKS